MLDQTKKKLLNIKQKTQKTKSNKIKNLIYEHKFSLK